VIAGVIHALLLYVLIAELVYIYLPNVGADHDSPRTANGDPCVMQTKASQGPGGMRPASASPSALRFQQHHEEEEGAGGVALQRAPTSLRATTQLAAAALNQGIEALKVSEGRGQSEQQGKEDAYAGFTGLQFH
jgi:hypothetical protein